MGMGMGPIYRKPRTSIPAPLFAIYPYLLASGIGREAIIIDPVRDHTAQYLQEINELKLTLVIAIDTHTHAEHITASGILRDEVGCFTVMGAQTEAECVSYRVSEGKTLRTDDVVLKTVFTPGHTNESFSFFLWDSLVQLSSLPMCCSSAVAAEPISEAAIHINVGIQSSTSYAHFPTKFCSIRRTTTRDRPSGVSVRSGGITLA